MLEMRVGGGGSGGVSGGLGIGVEWKSRAELCYVWGCGCWICYDDADMLFLLLHLLEQMGGLRTLRNIFMTGLSFSSFRIVLCARFIRNRITPSTIQFDSITLPPRPTHGQS